jgi:hypothetical protein
MRGAIAAGIVLGLTISAFRQQIVDERGESIQRPRLLLKEIHGVPDKDIPRTPGIAPPA